jgi:methanogenic corrinoid protein MtbC1
MEHEAGFVLRELSASVVDGDQGRAAAAAAGWVSGGWPAFEAVSRGLGPGLRTAGERFARKERFLPQTLLSLSALYAGLDALPSLASSGSGGDGRGYLVLGRVSGDSYAVCETLVETMATLAGFLVVRWEEGDPGERLAQAAAQGGADRLALFPVSAGNAELVRSALLHLAVLGRGQRVAMGNTWVSCRAAAALVDGVSAHNAREALEQAMRLAAVLVRPGSVHAAGERPAKDGAHPLRSEGSISGERSV